MARSADLSRAAYSVTARKVSAIVKKRGIFERDRWKLVIAISQAERNIEKLDLLVDYINTVPSMSPVKTSRRISVESLCALLNQAKNDSTLSEQVLEQRHEQLRKQIEQESSRYKYAVMYGQLVTDWLEASEQPVNTDYTDILTSDLSFWTTNGPERMNQRSTWESYAFKKSEIIPKEVKQYLETLFTCDDHSSAALSLIRTTTEKFEAEMAKQDHFDNVSLKWTIDGLLRSDLLTDSKRSELQEWSRNEVVLTEVADMLNESISNIETWAYEGESVSVYQRKSLNGKYCFLFDEALVDAILLQYVGVQWSGHFNKILSEFRSSPGVWRSPSTKVPPADKERRDGFLLSHGSIPEQNVDAFREAFFKESIFLQQLTRNVDEKRGRYADNEKDGDTRKSNIAIAQSVFHTLAADVVMEKVLGGKVTVVRTDFKSFGPSMSHSAILAVLKFFNVSLRWFKFFKRFLKAPIKFKEDGLDAVATTIMGGTPPSSPLSDVLAELTLFCLDFAFNRQTDGYHLYRLHDDIWFWGSEKACTAGWAALNKFSRVMGLEMDREKSGSARIGSTTPPLPGLLPVGEVTWGFLKLNPVTGRFEMNEPLVEKHVEELRLQLSSTETVLEWICAWNQFSAQFFATHTGQPSFCFGTHHVQMIIEAFNRIQRQLFNESGSSAATVAQMITTEYDAEDIRREVSGISLGFLHFPVALGGLELKNPVVDYLLMQKHLPDNPATIMEKFLEEEPTYYEKAKLEYKNTQEQIIATHPPEATSEPVKPFMSFQEYQQCRFSHSKELLEVYKEMLAVPKVKSVEPSGDLMPYIDEEEWMEWDPYTKYIVELYGREVVDKFGSLRIIEKGLLPMGMISMLRESRLKMQD